MPIDPSIEHGVFEPEATAAMGEAFEAACKELHDAGEPEVVRTLIAERIIAAASRGELDPISLRTAALRPALESTPAHIGAFRCTTGPRPPKRPPSRQGV
jgi:hypothetical protein